MKKQFLTAEEAELNQKLFAQDLVVRRVVDRAIRQADSDSMRRPVVAQCGGDSIVVLPGDEDVVVRAMRKAGISRPIPKAAVPLVLTIEEKVPARSGHLLCARSRRFD